MRQGRQLIYVEIPASPDRVSITVRAVQRVCIGNKGSAVTAKEAIHFICCKCATEVISWSVVSSNSVHLRHVRQNVEQHHKPAAANKTVGNMANFRHLGTTLTNKIAFTKKLRTG